MQQVINFYREGDEYGCFSNFSPHPILLDGRVWSTSEHYFQAKKFEGTPHEEYVRLAPTPGESAKMGRSKSRPLRKDWEGVKEDIMYTVCLAKFTQNKDIQKILLGTGDATLVEHTRNDSYWGDGGDGSGKNRLGYTLERVREVLRNQQA
jgi:ribA/ribD-fused uncharacterized protein